MRHVAVSGNDDDGDVARGGIRFHFGEHLEAVHPGHHDVEQHQVGRMFFDLGEGFDAVGGGDGFDAEILQFLEQIIDVKSLVIYDEDGELRLLRSRVGEATPLRGVTLLH